MGEHAFVTCDRGYALESKRGVLEMGSVAAFFFLQDKHRRLMRRSVAKWSEQDLVLAFGIKRLLTFPTGFLLG